LNAVYYRVSREDLNLDNQRTALRQFLPKKVKISEYVDTDSGALDDRKEWTRLKADIEAGTVKVIHAYHVDRLGRSTLELCRFLDLCEKHKAVIRTPGMNIDPSDEMARGFFQMAAIFAEIELRRIKRRTRDGIARAREQGIRLGRPPALTADQAKAAVEMLTKDVRTCTVAANFNVTRQVLYSSLRSHNLIPKNGSVRDLRPKKENVEPETKT